jgi:hypothetical protein
VCLPSRPVCGELDGGSGVLTCENRFSTFCLPMTARRPEFWPTTMGISWCGGLGGLVVALGDAHGVSLCRQALERLFKSHASGSIDDGECVNVGAGG